MNYGFFFLFLDGRVEHCCLFTGVPGLGLLYVCTLALFHSLVTRGTLRIFLLVSFHLLFFSREDGNPGRCRILFLIPFYFFCEHGGMGMVSFIRMLVRRIIPGLGRSFDRFLSCFVCLLVLRLDFVCECSCFPEFFQNVITSGWALERLILYCIYVRSRWTVLEWLLWISIRTDMDGYTCRFLRSCILERTNI